MASTDIPPSGPRRPATAPRHVDPHRLRRSVDWLDELLARPDAAKIIRGMPAQQVYLSLRQLGLGDGLELLRLCTPEQVQTFLDLDCWQRDRLVPERMSEWLVALTELGPQRLARMVEGMDHELLVTFLHFHIRVHEIQEDVDPPDEPEGYFYATPDRFYLIDILDVPGTPDGAIQRLLETLYMADLEIARRVIMGARWDIGAETEEAAYRFRSARMADLGYFDYHEALRIYAPLDPTTVRLDERTAPALPTNTADIAPAGLVQSDLADALNDERLLFGRLLRLLPGQQRDFLYQHLLLLLNQAMSADRVEPGDPVGARRVMERAAGYLSIALEYLGRAPTAAPGAAEGTALTEESRQVLALHHVSLPRLFRLGYTLTLQLARLTTLLTKDGLCTLAPAGKGEGADPASLLESPYAEVVRLLSPPHLRPLYSVVLDGAGAHGAGAQAGQKARPDAGKAGAPGRGPTSAVADEDEARAPDLGQAPASRPFRTLADIARCAGALEAVRAIRDFLTLGLGLRGDNLPQVLAGKSPPPGRVRHTDLLGTMVGNLLLQRPPALVPLHRRDLPALRQAALGLSFVRAERQPREAPVELSTAARAQVLTTLRERVRERSPDDETALLRMPPSVEAFIGRTLARLGAGLGSLPHALDAGDEALDAITGVPGLILD